MNAVPKLKASRTMASRRYLVAVEHRLDDAVAQFADVWSGTAGTAPEVLGGVSLTALLSDQVTSPGKKLRPTMAFWGWAAAVPALRYADILDAEAGTPALVDLGAALELLHVFALVQDDIMDDAPTRRGITTTHVSVAAAHRISGAGGDPQLFGDSIAVLVSDVAHALSEHLAAELPPTVRRIWRETVLELVIGQSLDLIGAAERRRDSDFAARVAWLKSGAYTVARPLAMGAAVAGHDTATGRALATYGRHIGMAFALRDDVLGVWGDPAETGKPTGADLLQGKATPLLALARDRVCGSAVELLDAAGDGRLRPDDVPALVRALEAAGILEYAEAAIAGHVRDGLDALTTGALSPGGIDGLEETARMIAWRRR